MFGPHVHRGTSNIVDNMYAAYQHANDKNFDVRGMQIFVSTPQRNQINIRASEITELQGREDWFVPGLMAHTAHTCHPFTNPNSIEHLAKERAVAFQTKMRGVVVHLPADCVTAKQLQAALETKERSSKIILEIPAVIDSPYDTPAKLKNLINIVSTVDPNFEHFELCIDTAHLWVNGYSMIRQDEVVEYLSEVGKQQIVMNWHLNDSEKPFHTGPDTHETLTRGHIWSKDTSGLEELVSSFRDDQIIIFERNPKKYEFIDTDYEVTMKMMSKAAQLETKSVD